MWSLRQRQKLRSKDKNTDGEIQAKSITQSKTGNILTEYAA